jgi:hypothetical protein
VAFDVELLARSDPDDTAALTKNLAGREDAKIIYTSETRSIDGIELSESVLGLPAADAVVADAGGSVGTNTQYPGIAELDNSLAAKWIGADLVRYRLRSLGHLVGEHKYETSRRYSCFPLKEIPPEDAKAAVEKALSDLPVDVTECAEDRIDISTEGVNTKSTLVRVLELLEAHPSRTIVAGQFVDEELIAKGGCWGIVTGEIKHCVKATMVHYPRVHITAIEGAAGIIEGLRTLGFD